MSYQSPSRKSSCRLSTPVRLGVAAVAACFISAPVLSLPVNPTVINGAASFNQTGNVLTVTNSNGAIINWQKFSIQAGETTYFAQTSSSSSVLNRVLNDPTAIYGTLSSNGRVWLVNPAGIMVGPGGKVDVAGFVASTLNISNADFLAGRNVFINDGNAKNVINQGEIRTPAGGSVYLIGSNVTNEGIIVTPQGETILAAGATVSLIDSATPGVKVDITGAEGNATNIGTITAEAGRIGIAGVIVRNSGQINASSVVSEGGRIFLKASQDAYVDGNGRIVTTGTKGGTVEVLGNRVAVMDKAEINASGANGGGKIMVGGDYQGKNPAIQNANITYFGRDASLKADATNVGDGGTVVVWSDDTTRTYGSISARGGTLGGNGGLVETSGKRYLDTPGIRVDVTAAKGKGGTWLLDPSTINIVAYGSGVTTIPPESGGEFSYGGNVGTLVDSDINAALGGFVIVRTDGAGGGNGNITATGVNIYGGGSLTLAAYGGGGATGNITIDGGSSINVGGGFSALAGWNGGTYTRFDVIDGTGTIKISDAQIHAAGNIELFAGKDIMLGSTNNANAGAGTWIDAAGAMTVRAKNLSLYGGQAAIFDISSAQGPGVWLHSGTDQEIGVENQILLQAGSANNTTYGGMGSMFYGGSVAIQSQGDQKIEATVLKLIAGAQGHDNAASVDAYGSQTIILGKSGTGQLIITGGGDNVATYGGATSYGGLGSYNNFAELRQGSPTGNQSITFESALSSIQITGGGGNGYGGFFNPSNPEHEGWSSNNFAAIHSQGDGSAVGGFGYGLVIDFKYGGTLSVTGGSGGNNNFASIGLQSTGGQVSIGSSGGVANLPGIVLTGGASGGKDFGSGENLGNSADIYSEAQSALTAISAASITINGGGDAATIGGAGIGGNNLKLQTTGALSVYGGASNLTTSFPVPGAATAAWIGTDDNGINNVIDIQAGNVYVKAGDGYGGAVLIGTVDGGTTTKIDIASYGGITVLSGTNSGVGIGNFAPSTQGGAEVTIRSANDITVTGTDNGFVTIGSVNGGANPTKVTLGSMRNVTLTKTNVGGWNGDADTGSVAVYGGYMDDGSGNAIASGYGGSLSFNRARIGGSLGDGDVALYAAASGASGGNISFIDGGGAYGASLDIVAAKTLTLDAQSRGVRLQTTTGLMSITADNFFAYGGSGIRAPGDTNLIGQDVSNAGASVNVIAGAAGQTINVTNTLQLKAGSINNTPNPPHGGSPYYGGSVTFSSAGNQDISAGTLRLLAGAAGHDNVVQIIGQGNTQNITATTLLELTGGGGGSNNYAWIGSTGANGTQKIDATGASIVLNGGASGGAPSLENGADITLSAANVAGSQTVYAGSITINGGGNATSYGGAGFGANNGLNQSFYVTGNLAMNGGASSAASPTASAAYIGSQHGGSTVDVQVGGTVTLTGGTGASGGVMIGSLDDSLGATTVKLSVAQGITATGNAGGVHLGVGTLTGATGSSVTMKAGWNAATASPSGQVGTIALNGPVRIQTDASGQIDIQAASGGGVTLGAGTGVYGGPISIIGDAAVALNGTVYGAGAVLAYGAGISIGAAGTVTSDAAGDAISLVSSTTFANSNVGTPLATPNGRWLVYAADPASVTKGGMTSAFRQYSTVYGDAIGSSGNGFIYASAPGVLNVNTTLVSGTASNTFGTAPTAVFGHVIAAASVATADSEDLAAISGTATFTPAITAATNVGLYTIDYLGGLTSAAGYTFAVGTGLAYTVNAVVLQVVSASLKGTTTKVYNGNDIASLTSGNFLLTGFVGSDSATITKTTGIYDLGKNVGTGLSVSTTLAPTDFLAGGSTNLGNYVLPTSAQGNIGTITKATISGVTGIGGVNKVYDRSTSAGLNTAGALFTGMYGGDILTVATATGAFANKNVGAGKTVNISGITLGGTDAGNYILATPTATTTADITPATISAVTGITGVSRVYDASINATLSYGGSVGFTGMYGGDVLTVASASGAFVDKNVGTGKTVNISGITLGGTDAGNYTLATPTATTTANITKATISAVTGITASNKVYDGNTTASLYGGSAGFTGAYGGDLLTVASASGQFANRNVGTGKVVSISGITLGGTDAGNYNLTTTTAATTANITQLASVAWIGPTTGNWSQASNWYGGALPDGQNVANVVIPGGNVVTFNSSVVPTTLTSLNSAGGLVIASGSLAVNSSLTTQTYQQSGGSLTGTGSLTVNGGFNQTGGSIVLTGGAPVNITTSGNATVASLSNEYGSVIINAANAILRASGSADDVNIFANSANLTSAYGGSSSGLAISAFTKVNGSLTATVSPGAGYGGISIQNFGVQPGAITLSDGATNPANLRGGRASISFYNAGDLMVTGANFSSSNNGDFAISSGGKLDYTGGLAPTSGSILLGAKGTLNMIGGLTNTGDLQLSGSVVNVNSAVGGANVQVSGNTININGTVDAAKNVALVAPLVGGTINVYGGVTANGTSATPSSINGIPYSGIAFVAQDMNVYGGSLVTTTATSDISGLVSGNITLDNGAYFKAGNDIDLVLAGGASTVALNGSYMLADYMTGVPATIFLDFLTRTGGGVMIDGTATTTSLPGGSGFFVVDTGTPAKDTNKTLVITYANNTIVDPCVSSPDLCKPPSPIDNPITDINDGDPCAAAPDSAQCKGKIGEKDKDKEKSREFGEDDTGKKDDKSSQKKVAQCT